MGSDQEGHWTPANRINLIRPSETAPGFYGNGWGATGGSRRVRHGHEDVLEPWPTEAEMTPPLCWLPPTVDRSPSSQVAVDHASWGPLDGAVLGLSYGTGEVYLILRDEIQTPDAIIDQGGIVKLGIQLPTGLIAGRIHPGTGDLYVCGLFGWSSDRTAPGGFYRIRPFTDAWAHVLNVPHRVRMMEDGIELGFLGALDAAAACDVSNWSVSAWNYQRSANYGSATYALDGTAGAKTSWTVSGVELGVDGRTVRVVIDDFEPAMQVHLTWSIADANGRPLAHEAYLTVHAVHQESGGVSSVESGSSASAESVEAAGAR